MNPGATTCGLIRASLLEPWLRFGYTLSGSSVDKPDDVSIPVVLVEPDAPTVKQLLAAACETMMGLSGKFLVVLGG